MKRMKRACWVVVVLSPQLVGCLMAPYPVRVELKREETAAFAGIKQVEVETRNGAIKVACDPTRTDVAVHAVASAHGLSLADARRAAESIKIEAKLDAARPGVLRVAAEFPAPTDGSRGYGASFRIDMPPTAELDLHTSNGTLDVRGAAGPVRLRTSNGEIVVADIAGDVSGKTSNGSVSARDVQGDIDLASSNGAMRMERVGKTQVKAHTSNGGVRIVEAQGSADVVSHNGSVYLQIKSLPDRPRVSAVTSNGRIEVELPASVSAKLEMETSNGHVHADLDNVTVHEFKSRRSHVRAVLNEGAGDVDLQSSNGSVSLRTKPEQQARPRQQVSDIK